jgi:hypothetical protein
LITTLAPDWSEVERGRELVAEHLEKLGFDTDVVHALEMVTGELLENAVKYGYFPTPDASIMHRLTIRGGRITIEVSNPTRDPNRAHFRRLDAQIQWIRGYQNAFEAYIEKLKEVSLRPRSDNESGLGLVRIAYEGQSVLDFFLDENNALSVSAVYTL